MSFENIINDYFAGKASLEETNAALIAAGSLVVLDPYKNVITDEEKASGNERNGWGMLDIGIGAPDKVEIIDGKLKHGVGNMEAYVDFNGKRYKVVNGVELEGI